MSNENQSFHIYLQAVTEACYCFLLRENRSLHINEPARTHDIKSVAKKLIPSVVRLFTILARKWN